MGKVKYNESKWTSGAQLPDRLITINQTEAYKLLESLNIDWKKISIPWAEQISKWNGASISPFTPNYMEAVATAVNEFNAGIKGKDDNRVDWLSPDYDYLIDNEYFTGEGNNRVPYLPTWASDGQIQKSEDIVDILNYLLWRVITLDFFTNNWNARNSVATSINFVLSWRNGSYQSGSEPLDFPDNWANPVCYKLDNLDENKKLGKITLQPMLSGNRAPQNVLVDNVLYKGFPDSDKPNIFPAVASNSQGILTLVNINTLPANIATVSINGEFIQKTEGDNNIYIFPLNIFVNGTASEYYGYNDFIYSDGTINYDKLDPKRYSRSISIKQVSHQQAGETAIMMSEANISFNLDITKTDNVLNSLAFNDVAINYTSQEINNFIHYTSTKPNASNTENPYDVAIPYYLNLASYSNKYVISYTLKYGAEYDIKPFFIIKNSNSLTVNANGTCHTNDLGSIEYDSQTGQYYYVPFAENKNLDVRVDSYVDILAIFYYADTNLSRSINPIFVEFRIKLNTEVQNEIQFSAPTESHLRWNGSAFGWATDSKGAEFVPPADAAHASVRGVTPEYNVSYCISTITYDTSAEKDIILFDDFIHAKCTNTNYNIDFLGVAYSQSYNGRTITVDTESTTNNFGTLTNTNSGAVSTILKEKGIKVGNNSDRSFYYVNTDDPENYNVIDSIISQLPTDDWLDDEDAGTTKDITVSSNATLSNYMERVSKSGYRNAFKILKSTAMYPNENGIYKPSGSSNYVDADNDYYFLVFKISAPKGTLGAISYSAGKGYFFLRVLRQTRTFTLNFQEHANGKLITYNMGDDEKSMRVLTRNTIFLPRLLDNNSQIIYGDYTGKKYWEFFNVDGTQGTNVWDDAVCAIKDTRTSGGTNREYMKIFNEGDPFQGVPYINTHNKNTTINPEGPVVNSMMHPQSGYTMQTVGKFNDTENVATKSGAILFVDQFMKAVKNTQQEVTNYVPIDRDNESMILGLSIGNDAKYKRPTDVKKLIINVYKQTYDLDILLQGNYDERIYSPHTKATSFWELNKTFSQQTIANLNNDGVNLGLYDSNKVDRIWIGSDEFGLGQNDAAEYGDALKIYIDSNTPKLHLTTHNGYSFTPFISISGNINSSNWILGPSDSININDSAYSNMNLLVIYPQGFDPEYIPNSATYNYAILLFPKGNSGQSAEVINVEIGGDDEGIYTSKVIPLYYKCVIESGVNVQQG